MVTGLFLVKRSNRDSADGTLSRFERERAANPVTQLSFEALNIGIGAPHLQVTIRE